MKLLSLLLTLCCLTLFAQDDTRLHMAIVEGDRTTAQSLIAENVNVDTKMARGWTPLMVAVKYGRTQIMNDLLRNGAKVDTVDESGNTALILAVTAKRANAVRILIANRANPTIRNKRGMSAREIAQLLDQPEIMSMLDEYLSQFDG